MGARTGLRGESSQSSSRVLNQERKMRPTTIDKKQGR